MCSVDPTWGKPGGELLHEKFVKRQQSRSECCDFTKKFEFNKKKNLLSVRADDEGLESVSIISIPNSLFKTRPEQTEIFSECASLIYSKTTNKAMD